MQVLPKKPFTWLLIAFIAYAYVSYEKDKPQIKTEPKKPEMAEVSAVPDKKEPGFTDKPVDFLVKQMSQTDTGKAFIETLVKNKMHKKYGLKDPSLEKAEEENKVIFMDKLLGKGDFAVCGSTVTLSYDVLSKYDIKVDSNKNINKPFTITLGEGSMLRGIENGVVGMRKGGVRKMAIPSALAYNDPRFENTIMQQNLPITAEVEVKDIKNGYDKDGAVTLSDISDGTGKESVLCGEQIGVAYKTTKGEEGEINFKMGDKTAPYGIEKALFGMKIGAKRSIIIPHGLLEPRSKTELKGVTFPTTGSWEAEVEIKSIN